jgi:hypothetical protein
MFGSAIVMLPKYIVVWLIGVFILSGIMTAICWVKGERPGGH